MKDQFIIMKARALAQQILDRELQKPEPNVMTLAICHTKIRTIDWILYGKAEYHPDNIMDLIYKNKEIT